LQVVSGQYKKRKVVQFAAMSREAVYNKLNDALAKGFAVAPLARPTSGAKRS
jgi:hypothetical protein